MPDALSKTIPIWCCVINRTLFGAQGEHAMYTPPQAVSSSEHAQISSKIDGFVQQFLVRSSIIMASLKHLIEAGYMQTRHPRASRKAAKAPASNLGHSRINTTRIPSNFSRLPPRRSLYCFTPRTRSRSIRRRLCTRRCRRPRSLESWPHPTSVLEEQKPPHGCEL
jgi:hypothetical protein